MKNINIYFIKIKQFKLTYFYIRIFSGNAFEPVSRDFTIRSTRGTTISSSLGQNPFCTRLQEYQHPPCFLSIIYINMIGHTCVNAVICFSMTQSNLNFLLKTQYFFGIKFSYSFLSLRLQYTAFLPPAFTEIKNKYL